jgi:hypothetical protein
VVASEQRVSKLIIDAELFNSPKVLAFRAASTSKTFLVSPENFKLLLKDHIEFSCRETIILDFSTLQATPSQDLQKKIKNEKTNINEG